MLQWSANWVMDRDQERMRWAASESVFSQRAEKNNGCSMISGGLCKSFGEIQPDHRNTTCLHDVFAATYYIIIYIHTHVCVCDGVCVWWGVCVCDIYIYTCIYIVYNMSAWCLCSYILYNYIYTHMCVCDGVCVMVCVWYIYIYTYIYCICVCVCIYTLYILLYTYNACVRSVRMCICII